MATTPNYGWVTPAPTDFVTDLPADFETFADAVDADLAGLLGGTTGQVLKKNSGTDHDFAWAVDPTTDVVTTAGDLIYGTGADAVTRLGIGTAGQVLHVNSGATAPEWKTLSGAALVKIGGSTVSGVTSATYDNVFSATYCAYKIVLSNNFTVNGAGNPQFFLRASGTNSTTNYRTAGFDTFSFSTGYSGTSGSTSEFRYSGTFSATSSRSTEFLIVDPFLAQRTLLFAESAYYDQTNNYGGYSSMRGGHGSSTSYDGFQLAFTTQTFSGTVTIYGLEL